MNETTVAYTMFALLLTSTICLLIGSAFGIMFKSFTNRTNRQELEAQLNSRQKELVKLPLYQQDIRNLRKQNDIQNKLIKNFMKTNLLLKKANHVSTKRLDETQRKLALQKVASENWKLKSETITDSYQQLKTKIADKRERKTSRQVTPVVKSVTAVSVSKPVLRTRKPKKAVVADDLTKIKGIGPTICKALYELGITQFDQIAKLKIDQVRELDVKLGRYGRMERLNCVNAARKLSKIKAHQAEAA